MPISDSTTSRRREPICRSSVVMRVSTFTVAARVVECGAHRDAAAVEQLGEPAGDVPVGLGDAPEVGADALAQGGDGGVVGGAGAEIAIGQGNHAGDVRQKLKELLEDLGPHAC